MSPIVIKTIQLLLSLSLLVILHEMGHFIPAKIFKTKVEKFFLFFDVKYALYRKKVGETVFGIGWLPLGGYVKIAGMIDESMDKEQLKKAPKPWEFRSKPAWQRLIIMLGGVVVNFVVGFLIYMMILFVWGSREIDNKTAQNILGVAPEMEVFGFRQGDRIQQVDNQNVDALEINRQMILRNIETIKVKHADNTEQLITIPDTIGSYIISHGFLPFPLKVPPVIDKVLPESPAEKAGIEEGALIKSINNTPVESNMDAHRVIKRLDTDTLTISFTTKQGNEYTKIIATNKDKRIGVMFQSIETEKKEYGLLEAISEGFSYGYWTIRDYVSQLKYIFTTKKGITGIGGFASIGNLFPPVWDWETFWERTAFISIMLAVLNLLPIPALDGGHIVFLTYEVITRRKPNEKILEYAQAIGIILLIGLALYANVNDIYRFLIK